MPCVHVEALGQHTGMVSYLWAQGIEGLEARSGNKFNVSG